MKKQVILLSLFIVMLLTSCSASKDHIYLQDMYVGERYPIEVKHEAVVHCDDRLSITVTCKSPELAIPFNIQGGSYDVSADGRISPAGNMKEKGYRVDAEGFIDFPILGKIEVEGKKVSEVKEIIQNKIIAGSYIKDPIVSIEFLNFKYTVLGATGSGTYTVPASSTSGGLIMYSKDASGSDYGAFYSGSDGAALINSGDAGGVLRVYDKDLMNGGHDLTGNTGLVFNILQSGAGVNMAGDLSVNGAITADGGLLRLCTSNTAPSTSSGSRIEFSYRENDVNYEQPVYISYTPNDSYRSPAGLKIMGGSGATPAWFEVEGRIYGDAGLTVTGASGSSTNAGIALTNGVLSITNYSNTVSIGSLNSGFCHFQNSASIPFYFNKSVNVDGDIVVYNTDYKITKAGAANFKTVSVDSKATLQYNSTDDCIDFIFA